MIFLLISAETAHSAQTEIEKNHGKRRNTQNNSKSEQVYIQIDNS